MGCRDFDESRGLNTLTFFAGFQGLSAWDPLRCGSLAQAPHRMIFNQGPYGQADWDAENSMSTKGKTHKMEFWTLASPDLGAIRIAVGEAWSPHHIMINHDSKSQAELGAGASMSTAHWTYKMEFWALPPVLQNRESLNERP